MAWLENNAPFIVLSMTLYLASVCMFQIVRFYFAPGASRNRLTFWPYWLMFLS